MSGDRVHIYRNRPDDIRPRGQMHFCRKCGGWYGVPHDNNHCQRGTYASGWRSESCACRFCREKAGRPVEGDYGVFHRSERAER